MRSIQQVKIVVCEDDAGILEVIGIALESQGYECVSVDDHTKLEEAIEKVRPDLVLLDLLHRSESGETILEQIRAKPNAPKIVLMSGHASLPDVARAHKVDYLPKPFDLDELKAVIERNL